MTVSETTTVPPECESLKAKGNELFKAKKYDEAVELYTEALAILPPPPEIITHAAAEAGKESTEASPTVDDGSSQLDPTVQVRTPVAIDPAASPLEAVRAAILSNRSQAHLLQGRFDAALADADACIRANPGWAKGHFRRAYALKSRDGATLTALHAFEQSFKREGNADTRAAAMTCVYPSHRAMGGNKLFAWGGAYKEGQLGIGELKQAAIVPHEMD
eukprot:CAMPEP_0177658738 /NCGR_PEP_ID=MMETSP0447-20121125/17015_1 /TAXON_ID=0 /ORGANISM="Stygamoeba regulata, Strain BSH-02190019" /LENGTH=217 /DNA_ID=CAMNT_0019163453 /DNA_START=188 /DNA_END=838 /DNA_ORIENTATION=-